MSLLLSIASASYTVSVAETGTATDTVDATRAARSNTVGTSGRDYSTIAAWAASLPANLVTDNNSYVGYFYNDSEFLVATASLTGHTTDSTHTITMTTGPGQSFRDAAGVATNALRYNVSNGVGFNFNGYHQAGLLIDDDNVLISNIQINGQSREALRIKSTTDVIDSCILQCSSGDSNVGVLFSELVAVVRNTAIIQQKTSSYGIVCLGGLNIYNCTIVNTANTSGIAGIAQNYGGASVIENTAIFGFTNTNNATWSQTWTSCATDVASPPTGFTGSLTYANQFVNTGSTPANADFRLKTGADLINAGTTDTTDVPSSKDIIGTTRPQGASWDIGAWEYFSAGTIWSAAIAETGSASATVNATSSIFVAITPEGEPTNWIRNNTMVGAATGTPGTAPTNWSIGVAGTTLTIVGTGVENGITYIELQISGTPTGVSIQIAWETIAGVLVSNGQTWTHSFYLRLTAGSWTNVDFISVRERLYDARQSNILATPETSIVSFPTSASLDTQRFSNTYTVSGFPSAMYLRPMLYFEDDALLPINFTIRIGMPQIQTGSTATAPIPTSGTIATQDAIEATNITTSTYVGVISESGSASDSVNTTTSTYVGIIAETDTVTNIHYNNSMAGTLGASSYPTGWNQFSLSGLTESLVATGTDSITGLPYADFRFSGTSTSTFVVFVGGAASFATAIPAAPGPTVTYSAFAALVANVSGNLTDVQLSLRWSTGAFSNFVMPLTANLQRYSLTTSAPVTTTSVYLAFQLDFPSGVACDFTIRLAAPQYQTGAVATYPILTTAGPVTLGAASDYPLNAGFVTVITESGTATDTVSATNSTYVGIISETGTAADTLFASYVTSGVNNESGTASDTVSPSEIWLGAISESGSNSDSANATTSTYVGVIAEASTITNIHYNNSMAGSTIGSSNYPTGWGQFSLSGLTESLVATGTDTITGLPYTDFRFSGTSTATFVVFVGGAATAGTTIPATPGPTVTYSVFAALVANVSGNLTDVQISLRWSTGAFTNSVMPLTASLQRYSLTTSAPVTTTSVYLAFQLDFPSGVACDFTIRLAAPQYQIGAVATYPILTTAGPVTLGAASDYPLTAGSITATVVTESGTETDTTSATNSAFVGASNESGTVADSVNAAATWLRAISESGSASDTITASYITFGAISESGTTTDTVNFTISTYTGIVGETGAIADSTNATNSIYVGAITESGSTSDTLSVVALFAASLTETGVAGDSISANDITSVVVSETGTAADTTTANLVTLVTSAESGTATDTANFTASTFIGAATESGTATDTLNFTISTFIGSTTESGTATDAISAVDSSIEISTESGSATDTSNTTFSIYTGSTSESGSASDAVNFSYIGGAIIGETGTASAAVNFTSSTFSGAIAESGIASDAVNFASSTFSGAISESGIAADSVNAANSTFSGAIAESGTASDSISSSFIATGITAESGSASDSVNETISTYVGAITETGTNTDSTTANFATASTTTENGSTIDAVNTTISVYVGIVNNTGNAVDSTSDVQITSGAITEAASAADATSITYGAVAIVAESGSASDSVNETNSTFNGNTSESGTATDSIGKANSTFVGATIENGNASDTLSDTAVYLSLITETGSITDSVTSNYVTSAATSENGSATDATTSVYVTAVTISETASGADSSNAVNSVYIGTVSESGSTIDAMGTSASIFVGVVTESGTAADVADDFDSSIETNNEIAVATDTANATSSVYNGTITESTTLSDLTDTFTGTLSQIAETGAAVDSVSTTVSAYVGNVSEVGSGTDAVSCTASIFVGVISESGATNDTASSDGSAATGSVAETGSISETIFAGLIANTVIDENASLIDTMSEAPSVYVGALIEAGAAADNSGMLITYLKAVSETGVASDTTDSNNTTTSIIAESAALSDTMTGFGAIFVGAVADTATIADSSSSTYDTNTAVTESSLLSETSAVAASVYGGANAETTTLIDTTDVTSSLYTGVISDIVSLSDNLSTTQVTTENVVEGVSPIDQVDVFGSSNVGIVTESGAISDTVTEFGSIFGGAIAEITVIADVVNGDTGQLEFTSEQISAIDAANVTTSTYSVTISETGELSDTETLIQTIGGSVSETGSLIDLATSGILSFASVSETESLLASTEVMIATWRAIIAESGSLVDHDAILAQSIFNENISESGTIEDTVACSAIFFDSIIEHICDGNVFSDDISESGHASDIIDFLLPHVTKPRGGRGAPTSQPMQLPSINDRETLAQKLRKWSEQLDKQLHEVAIHEVAFARDAIAVQSPHVMVHERLSRPRQEDLSLLGLGDTDEDMLDL